MTISPEFPEAFIPISRRPIPSPVATEQYDVGLFFVSMLPRLHFIQFIRNEARPKIIIAILQSKHFPSRLSILVILKKKRVSSFSLAFMDQFAMVYMRIVDDINCSDYLYD